jgi:class 3 adenylate cyclase
MSGRKRSLERPDEEFSAENVVAGYVRLGDLTIGRVVQQPGWRWSTYMRPIVGGTSCQARHVGLLLQGGFHFEFEDGSTLDVGPNEVYEAGPGHDSWIVGDIEAISIEWEGLRRWSTPLEAGERTVATLLFTDVVESTATATRLGEAGWSDLLARHNAMVRGSIERHRGNEISTTGDGFLVTFDGAARAIRCALEIVSQAQTIGLRLRAGVHTGEVERVGADIRGIAVHEAARVAAAAAPDQVMVSEVTRALAGGSGLDFGPGHTHELKGLEGSRVLYPVTDLP